MSSGEQTCDRECDEVLRHWVTSHVRQFTAPKVRSCVASPELQNRGVVLEHELTPAGCHCSGKSAAKCTHSRHSSARIPGTFSMRAHKLYGLQASGNMVHAVHCCSGMAMAGAAWQTGASACTDAVFLHDVAPSAARQQVCC